MPIGMEVGLGPGHIVLDGDPAPPPQKGGTAPIFGLSLLWPNDWMDQDATWYGGRPRPRPHCVTWGPSSPPRGTAPNFWPVTIVGKRSLISATAEHLFYFILGIVPSPHWWTDLDIQSATTENRRGKRKKKKKERNHSCKI